MTNSTKDLPTTKSTISFLQSIGVEYGRNLNAYTSVDKTVYFFTDVPTARVSAVDS